MITRYAVLNPQTGIYEFVDNTTDINNKIAEVALALYLAHTHNSPVSKIKTDESGAETWYNMNDEIINQSVVTDEIKRIAGYTSVDGVTV